MGRAVILRHDLSDGSHHFDLLIEPAEAAGCDPDERTLVAWRLPSLPDGEQSETLTAQRLAPHRRLYLDYEGPVSGDRGRVSRVWAGEGGILTDTQDRFRARIALDGLAADCEGSPADDGAWALRFTPHDRGR